MGRNLIKGPALTETGWRLAKAAPTHWILAREGAQNIVLVGTPRADFSRKGSLRNGRVRTRFSRRTGDAARRLSMQVLGAKAGGRYAPKGNFADLCARCDVSGVPCSEVRRNRELRRRTKSTG